MKPANTKKIGEYPCLLTKGKKIPAAVVETIWLITSAMLMPLDRMRVGINSESASHTHTPGPSAKNATNAYSPTATCHPWLDSGTWPIRAFSILSGADRALSRSANGSLKNASTLLRSEEHTSELQSPCN